MPKMWPIERALDRVEYDPNSGCHLWSGPLNSNGYGFISRGRGHKIWAHHFFYRRAFGPFAEGLEIMHKCDTPACVNPSHLVAGTHAQNMADMAQKGRASFRRHPDRVRRGVLHPRAQYTEEQIISIRTEYAQGATLMALAAKHGVNFWSVHGVVTGKTFRDVAGPITRRL